MSNTLVGKLLKRLFGLSARWELTRLPFFRIRVSGACKLFVRAIQIFGKASKDVCVSADISLLLGILDYSSNLSRRGCL